MSSRLFRGLFVRINWLFVGFMLLLYVSAHIRPSAWFAPSLLGLAYPILLGIHIGFVVIWSIARSRYVLLSLGTLVVGIGVLSGNVNVSMPLRSKKTALNVVSYNVRNFDYWDYKKKEAQLEAVKKYLQLVKPYNPDFLCMQDFSATVPMHEYGFEYIRSSMGLPYQLDYGQFRGVRLFSRYPVIAQGELPIENTGNGCLFADVVVQSDTIRVYAIHLQSIGLKNAEIDAIAHPNDDEATYSSWRKSYEKLKKASAIRAGQVDQLRKHMDKCPYPIILAGDFNDPVASYTYAQLSKGMKDTFREKGNGIGTTYAGNLPMLRIDYILTSLHFDVLSFKTLSKTFSDHYPIYARVTLKHH